MGIKVILNNIPVLFEQTQFSRVATITVWSKLGSRDEQSVKEYGLTHFLEHMVFKGTKKRSAKDIAMEIESIGGELDAFTSRDNICLIAKTPKSKIEIGFNLLSDLLVNSKFAENDIKLEKSVVKEELRMAEDDYEDSGDEYFMQCAYSEKELGRSILGTKSSIDGFSKTLLKSHLISAFNENNTIISVAADEKEDTVFNLCSKLTRQLCKKKVNISPSKKRQLMQKNEFVKNREGMEGVNIYFAFETFQAKDENRYALAILNFVLGNGMSSRLFQKIREESGLAYSVFSSVAYSRNEGNLFLSASTSKENYKETYKLMENECYNLCHTFKREEFERGKSQLIGNLEMGLETSTRYAFFNARNEMVYSKLVSMDEVLKQVASVSYERVLQLADKILKKDNSITLFYGNV
jgi:predicted Zn-dependent peptidase